MKARACRRQGWRQWVQKLDLAVREVRLAAVVRFGKLWLAGRGSGRPRDGFSKLGTTKPSPRGSAVPQLPCKQLHGSMAGHKVGHSEVVEAHCNDVRKDDGKVRLTRWHNKAMVFLH
jgi:hypothetical protein